MRNDLSITAQAISFLLFVLGGVLLGLFYDILKITGIKYFNKKSRFRWYDLITAVLLFVFVLIYFLIVNNLQTDFYCFAGLIIGILLYLSAFSNSIRKFLLNFFNFFEKILKILLYPVKILCIIIKRFIVFNWKIFSKLYFRIKKLLFKTITPFRKMLLRAKKI